MPKAVNLTELSEKAQLVDVRTPSEFSTGHIAGAVNIPLDEIEPRIADIHSESPLVLICKAGTRARIAADRIAPCRPNVAVLDGGMDAWFRANQSVVVHSRTRWSLERQVRLIAGGLVLAGIVAARTIHGGWLLLSAFVGLGLAFAGLTDICGMGLLLARMPWNRHSKLSVNPELNPGQCVLKP